jgi:hypothetical protein
MFPEGACSCGKGLARAADLGVRYSHQVTDLPDARAVTTHYDRHEVECACGRVHVADAPPEAAGAPGTVTYELNFQAWCVFPMVIHHAPVERCVDIIESMSGIRPSDGPVHMLLERAARAVAAANKAIRALIILARVICGDETRSGRGRDRDLASFKGFAYSDLHGAVVVHDRCQNYDSFPGISHQLCCQHYPDTSTCYAISRTPPRATRRRSGPARSQTRRAASSTPPTRPATAA